MDENQNIKNFEGKNNNKPQHSSWSQVSPAVKCPQEKQTQDLPKQWPNLIIRGMDHMYKPPKQLKMFHLPPGLEFSWTLWYCCVPGTTLWTPVQFVYEQLFSF